jgi:Mg-chelatase subunit ChlD
MQETPAMKTGIFAPKSAKAKKKSGKKSLEQELDQELLDSLNDFDSKPFYTPRRYARTNYLDDMWSRRSFRRSSEVSDDDLVTAHRMVSSFVNALARGKSYEVVFDSGTSTAGTDMKRRRVFITTAPVIDTTITAAETGRVLTGLAVHEICHPRYGDATSRAVQEVWPNAVTPPKVSNLLDDIRIERRFVEEYPGYSGVFAPTLKYIADAQVKTNSGLKFEPSTMAPLDIGIGATRYPNSINWDGFEAERDWWQAWAERWAVEDAPRRHVEGVREALRHLAAAKDRKRQTGSPVRENASQPGDPGPSDDMSDGAAGSEVPQEDGRGNDDRDKYDDKADAMDDEDLATATSNYGGEFPADSGVQAVNDAAKANGVDLTSTIEENREADQRVKEAAFKQTTESGMEIDVVTSIDKLPTDLNAVRATRSDLAARYVRDAFMRSRTGHSSDQNYKKRGKLDQRGLSRTAHGDFRLFTKRTAQSHDKFLVWLMIDLSGSMRGMEVAQAAQVATAFAEASTHVKEIRLAVWAWSSNFRYDGWNGRSTSNRAGAALVWQSGMPVSRVAKMIDLQKGGTPDSVAMEWAGERIAQAAKRDERPLVLMCSDGDGEAEMNAMVEKTRARGVEVYGVSFGYSMDEGMLKARYGDKYVSFKGSIVATAKPLADLVARMVAPRGRR